MKQSWEIKKLGEVCDFQNGFAFQSKSYKEYGFPILRITNIQNNEIDTKELVYFDTKEYKVNLDRFKVYKGDLLIAMSGATTGKLGINKSATVFYLNQRVGKFIPKKQLSKTFLYYFLTTKVEESLRIAAGAAQPNLSTEQINNFKIPLPPLPEQQRIVSILDESFAAIYKAKAIAEQNLKNAKELFESYLKGVFEHKREGWEEKKLNEIFHIGSSKRIMEKDWTTSGVPFYGGKEIVKLSKFGSVVSNAYISNEKYNEYASKYDMPQQGDILITARGTIGVGYIVQKDDKFYYKDGNIISMRARIATNPRFILYALKSNAIYDQLKKLTGATVTHLPIERAKELVLMIPNYSTQNFFVEKIEEIEAETQKLEALYQKKIDDLEELKKSILQKAFAGELMSEPLINAD